MRCWLWPTLENGMLGQAGYDEHVELRRTNSEVSGEEPNDWAVGSATIICSAKVGMLFTHNCDKASGTNWCSPVPGTWYKLKSLSWGYSFHLNTLPVKVTLIYVRFIWSVFRIKYLLSKRSSNSLRHSIFHSIRPIQLWSCERLDDHMHVATNTIVGCIRL